MSASAPPPPYSKEPLLPGAAPPSHSGNIAGRPVAFVVHGISPGVVTFSEEGGCGVGQIRLDKSDRRASPAPGSNVQPDCFGRWTGHLAIPLPRSEKAASIGPPSSVSFFTAGRSGLIRLDGCTPDSSSDPLVTRHGNSKWGQAKALVRSADGSIVIFHPWGAYKIHPEDLSGSYKQLGTKRWAMLNCVLYEEATDSALVFHHHGLYRVDLTSGIATPVGRKRYGMAKACVWGPGGQYAVVFHHQGVLKVDTNTGEASPLGKSGCWGLTKYAINLGGAGGSQHAVAFTATGSFKVDLASGEYVKFPDSKGWNRLAWCWPLDPETRAVHTIVQESGATTHGGAY